MPLLTGRDTLTSQVSLEQPTVLTGLASTKIVTEATSAAVDDARMRTWTSWLVIVWPADGARMDTVSARTTVTVIEALAWFPAASYAVAVSVGPRCQRARV
jgi:hypothetical protein